MEARTGDRVRIEFTGRLEDGTIFDSTRENDCAKCRIDPEPLEFTIGGGEVISGLEQAVRGMKPGEKKQFTVHPDDAYGDFDEYLLMPVNRFALPKGLNTEMGQTLELTDDDGETFLVTVREVSGEKIILDANHPLAGKNLLFEVELIAVN